MINTLYIEVRFRFRKLFTFWEPNFILNQVTVFKRKVKQWANATIVLEVAATLEKTATPATMKEMLAATVASIESTLIGR